jgi:hypothetical protein
MSARCDTSWAPSYALAHLIQTVLCPLLLPAGRPLGPALTALLLRTQRTPGVSWRVGVGKVEEAEAEAAAARGGGEAGGARSFMRQPSRQGGGKVRGAVMTLSVAVARGEEGSGEGLPGSSDAGAGEGDDAPEDGAAVVVQLWRADLVSGVVELGPGCTVLRAEPAVGRLFGVTSASLLQHHLYQ